MGSQVSPIIFKGLLYYPFNLLTLPSYPHDVFPLEPDFGLPPLHPRWSEVPHPLHSPAHACIPCPDGSPAVSSCPGKSLQRWPRQIMASHQTCSDHYVGEDIKLVQGFFGSEELQIRSVFSPLILSHPLLRASSTIKHAADTCVRV